MTERSVIEARNGFVGAEPAAQRRGPMRCESRAKSRPREPSVGETVRLETTCIDSGRNEEVYEGAIQQLPSRWHRTRTCVS